MDAWMSKTVLSMDPPKKIKAPDSKLQHCERENGTYLVRMPCSVSVCHPGVCWLCGLPGCGVCACVCDWWVWERVQEYSVTQESNVAACGFLTGSIVVEGDMFSWGKARPVLSPPPTPQTLHPHTRTLGTLLITLIALTVQWRRTEWDRALPCSGFFFFFLLFLFQSGQPVCVFACVCVCIVLWLRSVGSTKRTMRMIQCLWPWVRNSIPTPSAEYLSSAEDFKWTDLSKDDNQHWCCCYIVFALQHSSKVTVAVAGLECHIKNRAARRASWGIYECGQMALCCIVKIEEKNKQTSKQVSKGRITVWTLLSSLQLPPATQCTVWCRTRSHVPL